MSYDVYVVSQGCPCCGRGGGEVHVFSCTWNVSSLVEYCLASGGAGGSKRREAGERSYGWDRLDGWGGEEALLVVEAAIGVVLSDYSTWSLFEEKEVESRQESMDKVCCCLRSLAAVLKEGPGRVIRVSG